MIQYSAFECQKSRINQIVFADYDKALVACSDDGIVCFWDWMTGNNAFTKEN